MRISYRPMLVEIAFLMRLTSSFGVLAALSAATALFPSLLASTCFSIICSLVNPLPCHPAQFRSIWSIQDVFNAPNTHLCNKLIYLDSGPVLGTVTVKAHFLSLSSQDLCSPWSHLPEPEGCSVFGLQKKPFFCYRCSFLATKKVRQSAIMDWKCEDV